MNPFSIDDKVRLKKKDWRSGNVINIMCGECEKCKAKSYSECVGEIKNKLLVSSHDGATFKRFKCHYDELELAPPLPIRLPQQTYDLSPKEIRPLGSILLDMPLIVPVDEEAEAEVDIDVAADDEESIEVEIEEEAQVLTRKESPMTGAQQSTIKPIRGMFFDQFMTLEPRNTMSRPI